MAVARVSSPPGRPSPGRSTATGRRPQFAMPSSTGAQTRLRVTLDRAARRGLFPRGERPALGTRRLPMQDRKALRKPGFPFRKVGSRRFGLSRGNTDPGFAGWGFLLRDRVLVEPVGRPASENYEVTVIASMS